MNIISPSVPKNTQIRIIHSQTAKNTAKALNQIFSKRNKFRLGLRSGVCPVAGRTWRTAVVEFCE